MTSDPDQIRGQITQTQQDLSANVDALTEKVRPQRIAQRRVQRTRAAITDMKDKIMGSAPGGAASARDTVSSAASAATDTAGSTVSAAGETISSAASSAADAASSAPETVRQRTEGNPLAAGLIAFGAGWLISSLLPSTPAEQQAATKVKDTVTEQGRPAAAQLGEAAQDAKEQLGESARQAAESVKDTAAGAVSAVQEETQSAAGEVTGRAQQAKDKVTKRSRSTSG